MTANYNMTSSPATWSIAEKEHPYLQYYCADIDLQKEINISYDADIKMVYDTSYNADTYLTKENNDISYNADIDLQKEIDISYNADIILRTQNDISYNADIILQTQNDISYNADIILRTQVDISYNADIILQTQTDISYNADIDLQKETDVSYDSDIYLTKENNDISYEADVILKTETDISYKADIILQTENNISYSADINIVYDISYNADLLTVSSYSGTKIISAGNKLLISGSWTEISISDTIQEIYEIHQLDVDTLLACTDQGLWKSVDNGVNWEKLPLTKIWGDLRGEIQNISGQDIIDAEVILLGTPNNFAFADSSDGSGNYAFTNIDSTKNYVLMASRLPIYGIEFVSPMEIGVSEDKVWDITLPQATANKGHLVGIISDLINGDYLLGVTVKLIGATTCYTTTTDNYVGLFCFADIDPGYYELEFSQDGYFNEDKRAVLVEADEITYINLALKKLTAQGELSNLNIVITDSASGDYIYNAKICFTNLSTISYESDTYYTDVLGEVVLTNILNGRYLLEVKKDNYEIFNQEIDLAFSSDLSYNISLESLNYGGLEGFVVDVSTKLPISGAQVVVGEQTITTDGNGYYQANNLQVARYSIATSATGYYPMTFYATVHDGIVDNYNLYMLSTSVTNYSSITMNVYSQADTPVNEVIVTLNGSFSYSQTTNAQGQIIFSYLPYGDYYISVNKNSYKANGVKITTNANNINVSKNIFLEEIILENTATLIGHIGTLNAPSMKTFPVGIVNSDGDTETKRWLSNLMVPKDVGDATIYLSNMGKFAANDSGRFVISNIEAGTYQLLIKHTDYNDITVKWIVLGAGEVLDLTNLILTNSDSAVKGTVYHITEYYGAIAHATIMDKDTTEMRFTDGEGNYEWTNLRSNRVSLTAIKDGYIPSILSRGSEVIDDITENAFRQIDSDSANEFEFDFELREADEDSIFWGFVLDDRNGRPISGATINIDSHTTTTDSSGFYLIKTPYGDPIQQHTGSTDLVLYHKPVISVVHDNYFTMDSAALLPGWQNPAVPSKTSTMGNLNFNLARKSLYPYYVKIKGTVQGEVGYNTGVYTPLSHAYVVLSSSEGSGEIDPDIGGYLVEKQLTQNTNSPNFEFYLVFAEPPTGTTYYVYANHYSDFWIANSTSVTVTPSVNPVFEQYEEVEIVVNLRRPKYPTGGGTLIEGYTSNVLAGGKSFIWGHIVESISGRSLAQSKLDILDLPQDRFIPTWTYGNNYSVNFLSTDAADAINKIRGGLTLANNNLPATIYVKNNREKYFADIILIGRDTDLRAKLIVNPLYGSKYVGSDYSSELSAKLFVSYPATASVTSNISDFYNNVTLPADTVVVDDHQRIVGHSFFAEIGMQNRTYDKNEFLMYVSSEGGSDSDGVFFVNWVITKLASSYNYINADLFFTEYPEYAAKYSSIDEILNTIDVHSIRFNVDYQHTYGPLNFALIYPEEFFDTSIEDPDPDNPPEYPGSVSYVVGLELHLPDYNDTGYWGQFSRIKGKTLNISRDIISDTSVALLGGFRDQTTLANSMVYDIDCNYEYDPVWSGYSYQILASKTGYKTKIALITQVAGSAPSVGLVNSGDLVINGVNIGAVSSGSNAITQGGNLATAINLQTVSTKVYADCNQNTGALTLYSTESDNNIVVSGNALTYTGLTAGVYYPDRFIELPRDKTLGTNTKINIIEYIFDIILTANNSDEAGLFGYIYNQNGSPLSGASIVMGVYNTTTDTNGFYILDTVAGAYDTIAISKSGYIIQELSGLTLAVGEYNRRNIQLIPDGQAYGQLRLTGEANTSIYVYGPLGVDDIIDNSGNLMVSALLAGTYYVVYNKQGEYAKTGFSINVFNGEITTKEIVSYSYAPQKIQIAGMVLQQLSTSSTYEAYDDSKFINYKQAKYLSKILQLPNADIIYGASSTTTDSVGMYSIDLVYGDSLNITAIKDSDNFYEQSLRIARMEAGKFYERSLILINNIEQIEVYTLIKTEQKFDDWIVLLGTNYGLLGARF